MPISTLFSFPCRRVQSGLSLFDSLIALAIISLLSGVAVASVQPIVTSVRGTTAVNNLVTSLHLARSEAIRSRQHTTICPTIDGRQCQENGSNAAEWHHGYLTYIDRNANHRLDADEPVVRVVEATPGMRITTAGRNHVTFQPNGFASGTNATFRFCSQNGKGQHRAVVLANSGRPRALPAQSGSGC